MIPLYDENPTKRFPIVTIAVIAANVAVFAYELSLGSGLGGFVKAYAFTPARFLAAPLDPAQWLTVLTSMFMHGGWLHIGFNMLYLWIFGNNVEDRLGRIGFIFFYLLSGSVGDLSQALAATGSLTPTIGASGAIAGVLGAYLVLFPSARVMTAIPIIIFIELARLPAAVVIGFWFLLQLASGIAELPAMAHSTGGTAFFAHIGGFVAGALIALAVKATGAGRTKHGVGT
jgi:membrane associated rhomboid family serine protease